MLNPALPFLLGVVSQCCLPRAVGPPAAPSFCVPSMCTPDHSFLHLALQPLVCDMLPHSRGPSVHTLHAVATASRGRSLITPADGEGEDTAELHLGCRQWGLDLIQHFQTQPSSHATQNWPGFSTPRGQPPGPSPPGFKLFTASLPSPCPPHDSLVAVSHPVLVVG